MGYLKPVLSSSIPHSFSLSSLVSSPGRCLTVRFRWYAPCDLASSLNEGFVVSVEHGMITTKGLPNSRRRARTRGSSLKGGLVTTHSPRSCVKKSTSSWMASIQPGFAAHYNYTVTRRVQRHLFVFCVIRNGYL